MTSIVRTKFSNVIKAIIQFLANSKCTREGIFIINHSTLTDNLITIGTKMAKTKLFQGSQGSGSYKTFVHMCYFFHCSSH